MNHIHSVLIFSSIVIVSVTALKCAQCEGIHGFNPKHDDGPTSCDNRNNHCQTDQYCVKIIDPMAPTVRYTTFKSDCWFQNTLLLTPSNQTIVGNKMCYTMIDASVPPKTWKYCFCNDRDYCNSKTSSISISFFIIMLIIIYFN